MEIPVFCFGYKVKNGNELDMPADSGYEGKWQDGMPMYNNTTCALDTTNPDSNGQTYNYEYWPNVLALSKSEIEEDWREARGADSAKEYLCSFRILFLSRIPIQRVKIGRTRQ